MGRDEHNYTFPQRYFNSLLLVLFGEIASLCLSPDSDRSKKQATATKHATMDHGNKERHMRPKRVGISLDTEKDGDATHG